jgi:hypothetical protein
MSPDVVDEYNSIGTYRIPGNMYRREDRDGKQERGACVHSAADNHQGTS